MHSSGSRFRRLRKRRSLPSSSVDTFNRPIFRNRQPFAASLAFAVRGFRRAPAANAIPNRLISTTTFSPAPRARAHKNVLPPANWCAR